MRCDICSRPIVESKVTLKGNHRDYTCECKRELQWDVLGTAPSREAYREGPAALVLVQINARIPAFPEIKLTIPERQAAFRSLDS